jgi:hypothetical protein
MIGNVTTVPKARLGKRIGKLNDEDVVRMNRALTEFRGIGSLDDSDTPSNIPTIDCLLPDLGKRQRIPIALYCGFI